MAAKNERTASAGKAVTDIKGLIRTSIAVGGEVCQSEVVPHVETIPELEGSEDIAVWL